MSTGQQGILAASGTPPGKTVFAAFRAGSTLSVAAGVGQTWGAAGQVLASTTASYAHVGIGGTVTDVQVPWIGTNGTVGGSGVFVDLVTTSGSLATITIPSGSTAYPFQSSTSAALPANRALAWAVYNGASSGSIQMNSFAGSFIGTTHAQLWAGTSVLGFTTASASRYLTPAGSLTYRTVLAQSELRVSVAGTIRAWGIYVNVNSRGTATTFTLTVNGVGVSTQNVFASTPGLFYATTSIPVVPGDLISVTITTGTGPGTITTGTLALTMDYTGRTSDIWMQMPTTVLPNATWYFPIIATSSSSSSIYFSITGNQLSLRFNATLSNPQLYLITNSLSVAQTWTLMVNGVASAVSITVPALTTGWVTGTGSVAVLSTDLLAWRLTTPAGSGTSTLSYVGLQIEYTSG